MAAYHNPDWAECYDLWVRKIFGDGLVEDIAVFESLLADTVSGNMRPEPGPVTIVDIGTGSGRVLIQLQSCIQKQNGIVFDLFGLEPSSAMLNRAKRFWREALEAKGMQDNKERLKDQWLQVGATSFAKEIGSGGADLVIFAAGGICHVTKDEEVLEFLKNVHAGLKKGGKAIISVLRDLITQEHGTKGGTEEASDSFESLESASAKGAKAQHIPSIDKPGEIYVKHPTTGDWKGNIKTERFRLDIEDEAGKLLRSHELEWDERVLDKDGWVRMVTGAGLRVKQVIDGEIQIWYILEKAYG